MRCAVCGTERNVNTFYTQSGVSLGQSCGEHSGLLWEAAFLRANGGSEYAMQLVTWRWRRARCEAEGVPFSSPAPQSEAELALEHWVLSLDPWMVAELS